MAKATGSSERGTGRPDRTVLDRHYATLESSYSVRDNADYQRLVVPNGNGDDAIHRWFRLKEAYSRKFLPRVIKDAALTSRRSLRILDPFAGSGTTALSAVDLVREGSLSEAYTLGYECNPFIHLVANTKLRSAQTPSQSFGPLARKIAAAVVRDKVDTPPTPELATFRNDLYFRGDDLTKLLQLRAAIDRAADAGADSLDIALAQTCLGACVEPVSSLRRDGRALRYVTDKPRLNPVAEFLWRADQVCEDMTRRPTKVSGRIQLGDGRSLSPRPPTDASMDLVVFSPPYPNNIDYTEVYKMEAWLLGFITTAEEFSDQRLRTVYSHPSILRRDSALDPAVENGEKAEISALLEPIIDTIPNDRYRTSREQMVTGYTHDMYKTLDSSWSSLAPGGTLVYAVGNSLHGSNDQSFVIAADLIIARLAELVGFSIESIEVARQLHRRKSPSPFLRESVVFARRPRDSQGSL